MNKLWKGGALCIVSLMMCFCSGGYKESMADIGSKRIMQIPSVQWKQLAHKKIFWGHQSVGSNIIDGLQELLSSNRQIPLKVSAVKEPYTLSDGTLSHAHVGSNGDPFSKIEDFERMIDSSIGVQADYAFFKFCFIDFNRHSDVGKIFEAYKKALHDLQVKYPRTKFLHTTVPLVKVETGPKTWIKKIIGRTLDGTRDNVKRHEFNELIREEYGGEELIFDIARYESTRPDGSRQTFDLDGKTYYALVPAYTTDGGHLNRLGSRYLAAELLTLLVKTSMPDHGL